jgi:HK97 family phage portal protein
VKGLIEKVTATWSPVRRGGRATSPGRAIGLSGGGRTEQLDTMAAVGTVFGIVDRISTAQSEIEWCLYRKAPSGRREDRAEYTGKHLAIDRWNKPNDFHDQSTMVEMVQQHYELTGEGWMVVDLDETFGILMGMWSIRPDRIRPVPGTDTFLAGYIYTSVDGEEVPLKVNEVLSIKRPNPKDPYRGIGAIQSVLLEIQSARAAAEWNRNFFRNGAMPGGVIEVPNELSDTEFQTLITRWRESHRGVSRAHRVGVLEHGAKFTPVSYSIKDMQMTEVRGMTRDSIMEAFGISRHMLGITEDVNRAVASAGEYMFAKYISRTRARRWRSMLNNFYLPLFGATTVGLEWDFHSPVPEDTELENATRESKANAAKTLTDAGFDRVSVAEMLDLPLTATQGLTTREQAEIVQKIYLGVGIVLTDIEARHLLADAGFAIDPTKSVASGGTP